MFEGIELYFARIAMYVQLIIASTLNTTDMKVTVHIIIFVNLRLSQVSN